MLKITVKQKDRMCRVTAKPIVTKVLVTKTNRGRPGVPGKSAYQTAQEAGYPGTEADFAAMLISIKDKQDKVEIGNPMVSLLDIYNLGKL